MSTRNLGASNYSSMANWGMPVSAMPVNIPMLGDIEGAPVTDMSSWASDNTLAELGQGSAPSFMDGMLGFRGADNMMHQGWGMPALSAANSLMQGYLGFKNLGIAKDTLAQNKKQFDLNFGAQRKMTNSRLADRQQTRLAANSGNTASVAEYMGKYGI